MHIVSFCHLLPLHVDLTLYNRPATVPLNGNSIVYFHFYTCIKAFDLENLRICKT